MPTICKSLVPISNKKLTGHSILATTVKRNQSVREMKKKKNIIETRNKQKIQLSLHSCFPVLFIFFNSYLQYYITNWYN